MSIREMPPTLNPVATNVPITLTVSRGTSLASKAWKVIAANPSESVNQETLFTGSANAIRTISYRDAQPTSQLKSALPEFEGGFGTAAAPKTSAEGPATVEPFSIAEKVTPRELYWEVMTVPGAMTPLPGSVSKSMRVACAG